MADGTVTAARLTHSSGLGDRGAAASLEPMHAPSDPRWEPDPTGQRLVTIRAARRGAVFAALIFGSIVAVAVWLFPPEGVGAPPSAGFLVALMSLPGLALLGAGLTPAALGSRASAASAGVALGVGAPVFSVASSMFAVWIVVGLLMDHEVAGDVAGRVLRDGVTVAVRISPLVAAGCAAWLWLVRRSARS